MAKRPPHTTMTASSSAIDRRNVQGAGAGNNMESISLGGGSVTGSTTMAQKMPPCIERGAHVVLHEREQRVNIVANYAKLRIADERGDPSIYYYEIKIEHAGGGGLRKVTGPGDDALKATRQGTCRAMFEAVLPELCKRGLTSEQLVYDESRLLFALRKIPDLPIVLSEVPAPAEFGDGRYNVKIMETKEERGGQAYFKLSDLRRGDDRCLHMDLEQRDRTLQQYVDIISELVLRQDGVLKYGSNFYDKRYNMPLCVGRDPRDLPVVDPMREVMCGHAKGTRVTEQWHSDGTRNAELALNIDMKRAVVYKQIEAHKLVMYTVEQCGQDPNRWTPRDKTDRVLKKIGDALRDIFVRSTHRLKHQVEFKIQALTSNGADKTYFNMGDAERDSRISVAQYFEVNLGKRLRYVNLPLAVRVTGNRKEFYPMEYLVCVNLFITLCRVYVDT